MQFFAPQQIGPFEEFYLSLLGLGRIVKLVKLANKVRIDLTVCFCDLCIHYLFTIQVSWVMKIIKLKLKTACICISTRRKMHRNYCALVSLQWFNSLFRSSKNLRKNFGTKIQTDLEEQTATCYHPTLPWASMPFFHTFLKLLIYSRIPSALLNTYYRLHTEHHRWGYKSQIHSSKSLWRSACALLLCSFSWV